MKEFIKDLVNYVIEANYQPDQDAETHRLYRINRETSPSQAPAKRAETFRKINADYKEEKRLERAPRGPQTRPVVGKAKPVEEGAEVPKGTVTGPARKPTIAPAAKTQTKAPDKKPANPFSKQDWKSRKERMDQAIDG